MSSSDVPANGAPCVKVLDFWISRSTALEKTSPSRPARIGARTLLQLFTSPEVRSRYPKWRTWRVPHWRASAFGHATSGYSRYML
jgi:hypothetical protein